MLRDAVRDLAAKIQPQAVESYIEVRQLNGTNGIGYLHCDGPRPGSRRVQVHEPGRPAGREPHAVVHHLANEGEDTVAVQALSMLQAAVHRRTGLDQL